MNPKRNVRLRCPYCLSQYEDRLRGPECSYGGVESLCEKCGRAYMITLDNFVREAPFGVISVKNFEEAFGAEDGPHLRWLCRILRLELLNEGERYESLRFRDERSRAELGFSEFSRRVNRNLEAQAHFYNICQGLYR